MTRVLVFGAGEPASGSATVGPVRSALGRCLPGAAFCGGTDGQFADLNRARPPVAGLDGLAYSVNPQFHAFDDRSLVENLEGQAATVRTAADIGAGLPVVVSPVTLRPRSTPWSLPGPLPVQVDPRQASLLGAAWTVGSVAELVTAGVSSLTYYELTGWRGLVEGPAGPELPGFPSRPGMIFPVFHVFAALAGWGGAEVLPTTVSLRLSVAALALRRRRALRVIVANLVPRPAPVDVQLPASAHGARLRLLDERTADAATRRPDALDGADVGVAPRRGVVRLDLRAYAVAVLDAAAD